MHDTFRREDSFVVGAGGPRAEARDAAGKSPGAGAYGATQRCIETVAIALAGTLAVLLLLRVVTAATALGVPAAFCAAALGLLAADFLSGLGHWMGDTWGRVSWPVVGNGVIRGFREHHVDPKGITRHDFVETNGSLAVLFVPVLGLLLVAPVGGAAARFLLVGGTALALALVVTNQIHKWAHQASPPPAVRGLQRLGVILDPGSHAVHHRHPFDRSYCITTGWWNRPLDAIGAFRAFERIVTRMTGAVAREEERHTSR